MSHVDSRVQMNPTKPVSIGGQGFRELRQHSSFVLRQLPLVNLLEVWIDANPLQNLLLLQENQFPQKLYGQLQQMGFGLPDQSRFFVHDRMPDRFMLLLCPGHLNGPERQNAREALSHFLWNSGYSQKNCLLLALDAFPELQISAGNQEQDILALLVARSQFFWGERPLEGDWPPLAVQQLLQAASVATPANEAESTEKQVEIKEKQVDLADAGIATVSDKPVASPSTRVVPKSPSRHFRQLVLGKGDSGEVRKYYIHRSAKELQLALLAHPLSLGMEQSIAFFDQMQATASLQENHKLAIRQFRHTRYSSFSMQISATGRFECLNNHLRVLFWRQNQSRCYWLPDGVQNFQGKAKLRQLKGQLQVGDSLIFLTSQIKGELLKELQALIQHKQDPQVSTRDFYLKIKNFLDTRARARLLWIEYLGE